MNQVLPFILIMALINLAICLSGYMLFGERVDKFHTIILACMSNYVSLIDGLEYADLKEARELEAPLWAPVYIFTNMVLLNMFIAILCDSYVIVKERIALQIEQEAAFPLPPWRLYLRSKIPRKIG